MEVKYRFRRKMVDQPNQRNEPAPRTFRFWAQKNRNVVKETRARKTNLVRNDPRPKHLARAARRKIGFSKPTKEKRNLRRFEARSVKPRRAVTKRPRPRPRPPRVARRIQVQRPRPAMTRIPRPRPKRTDRIVVARGPSPLDMRLPRPSREIHRETPRRKLDLVPRDRRLTRIFARKWQRESLKRIRSGPKQIASTNRSERRWKRIRAALENYIPEVTPAKTTALRTRAHPFARYIAAMHRKIHPRWGDGILVDWSEKSSDNPLNDWSRWAMVELVLNADGSLNKAGIVKSSGYIPFDAAALEVVFDAAPFGRPPRAILSSDGKVYLHWRFHRDQRQCGTFGVDAFILNNRPRKGHMDEAGGPDRTWAPGRSIARLHRGTPLEVAPGHTMSAGEVTARAWFDAWSRKDADAMVRLSALPFVASGRVVARTKPQLKTLYVRLLSERPGKLTAVRTLTLSELRSILGRLPRKLVSGANRLFALARLGSNSILLGLCKTTAGFRVCEVVR